MKELKTHHLNVLNFQTTVALMQQFRHYMLLKKDYQEGYPAIAKRGKWLREMRFSGKKEKEQGMSQ